jgi:hypothetical protein
MTEEAKKKGKSIDDFIRDEVIPDLARGMPATLPETRNEKIDGDTATLELRKGEDWKTARFFKEADGWKVNV